MNQQSDFVADRIPTTVSIRGNSPFERGWSRGVVLNSKIRGLAEAYRELFRLKSGSGVLDVLPLVDRCRSTTADWWPDAVEELEGVAAGAHLPLDDVWMLNSRTELLAEARRLGAATGYECSVAIRADGETFGMQTWDWQEHMADYWHPVAVAGPGTNAWCGISEAGILGKIGMNDAGVALHFDILFHHDDGVGGVPVHLLATRILSTCTSLDEAVAMALDAPVSASTALSMHDGRAAATVELSPSGRSVVEPTNGWIVHANRFQTERFAASEFDDPSDPTASRDAIGRTRLLRDRVDSSTSPHRDDFVGLFSNEPNAEGRLSCVPDATDAHGDRWHTLVTIATDPIRRKFDFRAGIPSGDGPWRRMSLVRSDTEPEFQEFIGEPFGGPGA